MIRGTVLLLALLLTAASCSDGLESFEGDCLSQLEWNGKTYDGVPGRGDEQGAELARGVLPGCGEADKPIKVFAVSGVDPDVAVMTDPDVAETLGGPYWAGPGYLVISPKHPFHYESGDAFDDGSWNCGPKRSLRAEVAVTPPGVEDWIETRQGIINLDYNTAFEGIDRNGIPYVEGGDELEFVIRECADKEPEADDPENIPLLVAVALRP